MSGADDGLGSALARRSMPLVRSATSGGWAGLATGSIEPMFATLLGPLPRPALPDDVAPEALLDAILAAQSDADLEPLTDGGWPVPGGDPVAEWRFTQSRASALVKAVLVGPVSAGQPVEAVRARILGLADAGCAWIEIHEPAATGIGTDATAQARFAEAHQALTADLSGVEGLHLSLAITGGNADAAGIGTILSDAYASLALDLIDGPDNWRLVAATPGDRGIVCGALSAHDGGDESPELLLYAAGYAASTGGRGPARVGLATSGSLADLSWGVAVRKLDRLGAGAKLAAAPPAERRAGLDPRAVDIRSAALGTRAPRPPREPGPGRPSDA
jgi:hypothetical protein